MKQFSLDGFLNGGKFSKDSKTKKEENRCQSKPESQRPSKNSKRLLNDNDEIEKILTPNPTKALKIEGSLPFSELINVMTKVEGIKGENSKDQIKEAFANLFVKIIQDYPDDLPTVYYFLLSKVGPTYKSPEFGIGNGILEKVISKVIGISDKQIKEKMIDLGDLALVASEGKKTVQTMDKFAGFIKVGPVKQLTIGQIMNIYKEIAHKKGKSSQDEKMKLLCKIMFQANKDEIKFIVRSLQKSFKIGASFKTIISSLARGINKLLPKKIEEKEIYQVLLESINQLSDEDLVFKHIIELLDKKEDFKKLTSLCEIRPGIPFSPQLARPTTGINIIFARFEKVPFTCEYKYDGFRGQIHYHSGKTEIFSRNLENMTETYPDIVEYVKKFQKESEEKSGKKMTSFIIDCEMVAFDKVNNKILPFQDLTTRSRKNVDVNSITVHVCMFVFDIVYLNEEVLTKKTLRERRKILYETFTENEYIQFAKNLISENQTEIETFMTDSIASGCEGLIIKAIDKNSEYMPGQRNFNWLKLKKDYLDSSIGDSIDLVVIGAQFGKGKRCGVYGSFLLACYNDEDEVFETVTMTGAGLKDEDLSKIYEELKVHVVSQAPTNYRLDNVAPDVFFEPTMVWEIKTADLTQSPIYTAGADLVGRGISLRFPRFIRIRPDKNPHEVISSHRIVEMYKEQASITNNSKDMKNINDIDDLY